MRNTPKPKPKKLTLREQLDLAQSEIAVMNTLIKSKDHEIEKLKIRNILSERTEQRFDRLMDVMMAGAKEAVFPRKPGSY